MNHSSGGFNQRSSQTSVKPYRCILLSTLILLYVFLFLEASLMLRIMVTQSLLFKPYTDTNTDAKRYLELSVKLK